MGEKRDTRFAIFLSPIFSMFGVMHQGSVTFFRNSNDRRQRNPASNRHALSNWLTLTRLHNTSAIKQAWLAHHENSMVH